MEIPEILKFFDEMKDSDYQFVTIPAVVAEFSATGDLEKYNKRLSFLNNINCINCAIYSIERHIEPNDTHFFVFNKIGNNPGYVDVLLYYALHKFPMAFLLTENHKDFPLTLFDRKYTITNDSTDKQVRNSSLYQMNQSKLSDWIERFAA